MYSSIDISFCTGELLFMFCTQLIEFNHLTYLKIVLSLIYIVC
nr:MAG TPA: hypothetical protein [Bacteriophage sp.]